MLRATANAASSSNAFGWSAAEGDDDDDDEGGSDEGGDEGEATVAETFPQSAA